MSDDWYYVHQLAVLAGFRLIVFANRLGCEDEFLLELHNELAEGLAVAIGSCDPSSRWSASSPMTRTEKARRLPASWRRGMLCAFPDHTAR
ncbi:hypothetical protein ACOJBO_03750 [Rhizobium beringeri]